VAQGQREPESRATSGLRRSERGVAPGVRFDSPDCCTGDAGGRESRPALTFSCHQQLTVVVDGTRTRARMWSLGTGVLPFTMND